MHLPCRLDLLNCLESSVSWPSDLETEEKNTKIMNDATQSSFKSKSQVLTFGSSRAKLAYDEKLLETQVVVAASF